MEKLILLVDDSNFMRTWLTKIIKESINVNFIEANNGNDAIQMYKEFSPNLVLMDITMPSLSGIDTLKEIIKIDAKAKVIMCSAMGQQLLITEAMQNGATDFVIKPHFKNLVSTQFRSIYSA
ncbi:response regulator [Lysinibacillus sp. PLM2]|nr:response regulator [Lysinibacillus sp. PLM2]